jgi:hypothetical protein
MRPRPGKFKTRGRGPPARILLSGASQQSRGIERDLPAHGTDRTQGREPDTIHLQLDTPGVAGQERQTGLIGNPVNIAAAQHPGQQQGIPIVPDLYPAVLQGVQDDSRTFIALAINLRRSFARR